jgi:phage protein D
MLDPERQLKYGNSFTCSFPDYPNFTTKPRSAVLYQEMGSHDILRMTFQYSSAFLIKTLTTGTPVQFTWSNDKVSKTFYGYVSHVTYPVSQILNRTVTIECTGASYPLKDKESKIWTNSTADEIAIDIAKKFNLNPIVTPSNIRYGQQSLAGHSYFEKLNELADRIGYAFQVLNTDLHFHPIDKMIDQFMTSIPVMSFKDPFTNNNAHTYVQTLNSFTSKLGDYVESDKNNRSTKVVAGVDPITSTPYTATSSPNKVGQSLRQTTKDPLFSQIEAGTVANSSAMAKSLSDAKAQLSRLAIPGMGEGQGDPRISPWGTVEIRGTGSSSDGYWIVKSAEHSIDLNGKYQVSFTCATDGINSNQPSVTRPVNAGITSAINVASSISTASNVKPKPTKLSSTAAMLSQSNTGFKILPRRWVSN